MWSTKRYCTWLDDSWLSLISISILIFFKWGYLYGFMWIDLTSGNNWILWSTSLERSNVVGSLNILWNLWSTSWMFSNSIDNSFGFSFSYIIKEQYYDSLTSMLIKFCSLWTLIGCSWVWKSPYSWMVSSFHLNSIISFFCNLTPLYSQY